MKKIFLTSIIVLAAAYGYSQSGSNKAQNIQTTTIEGHGTAPDTIETRKTDFSIGKKVTTNYKKQQSTEAVLSPYFVSNMVSPDNQSHSSYLRHVQDGRQKLAEVKSALLKEITTRPSNAGHLRKFNLSNEADINSITYLHLPIYYISPNIVLFKDGDNIAKYYNLSTGALHYLLFRNNKLFGVLEYANGSTIVRPLSHELIACYYQIKKAGKNPIGLHQSIVTVDPKIIIGGINMLGCVEKGHLVYSNYAERLLTTTDSNQSPSQVNRQYVLQTAESFFAESRGPSIIQQWLDAKVNSMKQKW